MKYSFFLIIVVFLFSCNNEKFVTFDLSKYDSKIVVNSVNSADSILKIYLSKTASLNSDTIVFRNIMDADITVKDNFITRTLGDYVMSDSLFEYGYFYNPLVNTSIFQDTVYLKVNSQTLGTVTSKSEIPSKPEIKQLTYNLEIDSTNFGIVSYSYTANIHLKIHDNEPNKINYYAIKCYYYNDRNDIENVILTNSVPQLYDTYLFNEGLMFSDSLFLDSELNTTFDANIVTFDKLTSMYIEIKQITKDYYTYQKTYKEHLEASYSLFTEFLDVSSNVNNGYGIFTIYNSVIDTVDLQ